MAERIDSHQHFWRYDPGEYGWIDDSMAPLRRDFLPEDLRPVLDEAGVARCIAVQARQSLDETRFLLGLAAKAPWIAGVVGWIDLQADDVGAQLAEFASAPGFVGVRHIAQSEPDPRFLVSERFVRGIAALAGHDLCYDILVFPPQLEAATGLAERFPGQRFVLDHLGKPALRTGDLAGWARDLRRLARCPNVAAKVSGLVTEADWSGWTAASLRPAFEVALDAFGPDRLLFGSDWPVCLAASSYRRWTEVVAGWLEPLPDEARRALLGGNARRWYRLAPPAP